jgi:hypothetical protein
MMVEVMEDLMDLLVEVELEDTLVMEDQVLAPHQEAQVKEVVEVEDALAEG